MLNGGFRENPLGHAPLTPFGRHHHKPNGSTAITGLSPAYAYGVPVDSTIESTLKNCPVAGS